MIQRQSLPWSFLLLASCVVMTACGSAQSGAKLGGNDAGNQGDSGPGSNDGKDASAGPDADTSNDKPDASTLGACASAKCDDNASCNDLKGKAVCKCNTGYSGDGKTCKDVDECKDPKANICDKHASCKNNDGSYKCSCDDGYTGNGTACKLIQSKDPCSTALCSADATCASSSGKAVCTCKTGYSGDGKTCDDIDECTLAQNPKTCGTNAHCVNTPGAALCDCDQGYNGDAATSCVANIACPLGTECSANADCMALPSGGANLCICKPGFSGDGATCDNVDECATNKDNCPSTATCHDDTPSFHCSCLDGFKDTSAGHDATSCDDIDECGTNVDECSGASTCQNTTGSYVCNCPSGYASDGAHGCNNINECTTPGICSTYATCTDTTPSYQCGCPDGFTGMGTPESPCKDILECADSTKNTCAPGMCTETAPGYICGCNKPYKTQNNVCSCDLSGWWGMRQTVSLTWTASAAPIPGPDAIAAGSFASTVWELHQYRYDGSKLTVMKKGCGGTTPDLYSPYFKETYNTYVPNKTWDGFAMLKGSDVSLVNAKPGSTFSVPTETAVLGVTLADPTGAWPTRAAIDNSQWVDSDGDGVPGVMIWVRGPNESTMTLHTNPTYSYTPVYDFLTRDYAACISTATRVRNSMTGTVDSCTKLSGDVKNVSSDKHVYSCYRAADNTAAKTTGYNCAGDLTNASHLKKCTDSEATQLDGTKDNTSSTAHFELTKISDDPDATDISCQTVRTMFP